MTPLRSLFVALILVACGGAPPATSPAAPGPEGTVASADGVPIFYRSAGSAEPAVVFVHCWGCSSDEWSDSMAALASTHRVVALDLAGHGRSGKGRAAWTVPAFAADVRAVIEHLGIQRAIVVGHSMSGPIAIQVAVDVPAKVVGVVPVDTLLDVGQAESPAEIDKFFAGMRADYRGVVEKLVRSLFPKTADPALVDRVVKFELANDPAISIPVLENNWRFEVKDLFAKVQVPIVAINADLYPTNVAGNRALAPQFQAHVLEGVGHWPMLEAPQRFHTLLVQTIAEVTAGLK